MQNQPENQHSTAPSDPTTIDAINRGVAKLKCFFQEHRVRRAQESAADRAARRTAFATAWIAISTAATVGVGISHWVTFHEQLKVMQDTLTEMKNSVPQTAKILDANEKLAKATADMAATAKSNLETTGAIAGRQLRAKISIPLAEVESFEIGAMLNTIIQIENTGQGTANGRMRGLVRISKVTDSNFSVDRKTLSANVTVNPVSKISRPIQSFQRMTYEQKEAILAGTFAIVAYGDFRFTDESKAVMYCVFRLFYRSGGARSAADRAPVLRPTAGYNHCDEEKAPPIR